RDARALADEHDRLEGTKLRTELRLVRFGVVEDGHVVGLRERRVARKRRHGALVIVEDRDFHGMASGMKEDASAASASDRLAAMSFVAQSVPRMGSTSPRNLASSASSLMGRSTLPVTCSTTCDSTRPSFSVMRTSHWCSAMPGFAFASTRSRKATTSARATTSSLYCASPAAPKITAHAALWKTLNLPSRPTRGVRLAVS